MSPSSPAVLDQPLACLFEDPNLPAYRIPRTVYYANFAASIDGVVALEQRERSGSMHRSYLFLRYRLGEVNDNE